MKSCWAKTAKCPLRAVCKRCPSTTHTGPWLRRPTLARQVRLDDGVQSFSFCLLMQLACLKSVMAWPKRILYDRDRVWSGTGIVGTPTCAPSLGNTGILFAEENIDDIVLRNRAPGADSRSQIVQRSNHTHCRR